MEHALESSIDGRLKLKLLITRIALLGAHVVGRVVDHDAVIERAGVLSRTALAHLAEERGELTLFNAKEVL